MFGMDRVWAASYVAAGEYDGIGADTIGNCVAFARYKVPSLPGGLYNLQDKQNIINSHTPMAGAIAITRGNSSYGHVAYVESVSGANVVTLNGGFSGSGLTGHIVRITGTESEQGILGYWYPAGLSAGNNPQGSLDSVWGGTGFVHVSGWAFDKDDLEKQLEIHVYIGGPYGASGAELHKIKANTERWDVHEAYPGYGMYHGFDAEIQTQKTGEQPIYVYAMNTGGGTENPLIGQGTAAISAKDSENPVITDAKIYDVGQNGYMVSCKVTDNSEVDRVQFPTWTLAGEQDDLPGDWQTNELFRGTKDGDTYTFYVKRSEHNDEYGLYRTHIYAWDKAGNSTFIKLEDVLVEEDDETPSPLPTALPNIPTEEPTPEPTLTPPDSGLETPTPPPEESGTPAPNQSTEKPNTQQPQKAPETTTAGKTESVTELENTTPPKVELQTVIVPTVRGLSVKNQKGRKVKCSWQRVNGASHYSVQIALNRSFTKGNKGLRVTGTKHTRYALKKKRTYYVRVQAWKYVKGRGYVAGNWSAVKKVKIRK